MVLKATRSNCKFKGESLDLTLWRTRIDRLHGPVEEQATWWMTA
jgi:hypothetical protein